MAKPIDKNYLVSSLKSFDEQVLSKKYGQVNGGSENTIESISVNGTAIVPDKNKNVDIVMPDTSTFATTEYVDNAMKDVDVDLTGYAKTEDIPTVTNDLTDELKSSYDETVTKAHDHSNSTTLDKFSADEDGTLLYDGNEIPVGSSYIFVGSESDDSTIVISDISADFLTSDGFGNLRYYNGHFQYYDVDSSTWIDTSVSPENVYIINMMPQEMKFISGIYDAELGCNKLKWEEPNDTVIDNQVVCVVEKIIIRRKLDEAPADETDGELVLELNKADFGQYSTNWYIDDSISPNLGENWYYKAFPVSTTGFMNYSTVNQTDISCKDYYLFGFTLNGNESDPNMMITYLEDNKFFRSAYMDYAADAFNYGDWDDFWFIKDLTPCMLNYDGTVAYELNKNDYTLKADGTTSDITDGTFGGNAMIGFPKTYWKIIDNGDGSCNIYVSNKQVDEDFHCWSHIDNDGNEIDYCYMSIFNGSNVNSVLRSISGKTPMYGQTGTTEITYATANNPTEDVIWYTEVFADRMLINILLLLIGKSTDVQTVFGNGSCNRGSDASALLITGTLNNKGLFYGSNDSTKAVKVFGMENLWGNQFRRIAGWIIDKGVSKVKLTYGQSDGSTVDGYNTTGEGYVALDNAVMSGTSGGYISKMAFNEYGLFPVAMSGSVTTYYPDGIYFSNSSVCYPSLGGGAATKLLAGVFCGDLSSAISNAVWSGGASISCKPLEMT